MAECIFCKIVAGEIPSDTVYSDERVTAFHDINPAAPVHVLIIPNKHIESIQAMESSDQELIGYLFTVAKKVAEDQGIAESGYRLIINNGPDAHQEVPHLHLHVLGGHSMQHPMG